MVGGALHGDLRSHLVVTPEHFLEKRGLMLLPDSFMLFRDSKGVKQRIAPDLIVAPFRSDMPTCYDLEIVKWIS